MNGEGLLLNVFGLSLSAGALILILLLLRSGLARRYSARWRCVVWVLLAVRLLIPLPLESGLVRIELPQRLNQPQYGQSVTYQPLRPNVALEPENAVQQTEKDWSTTEAGVSALPDAASTSVASPVLLQKAGPSVLSIACGVWKIGMILCAVGQLLRYFIWRRQTMRWNEPVENPKLLEQVVTESRKAGLSRPPQTYCNAQLCAPLVLGYFRPILLLPENFEKEAAVESILRHECIHLRRGDLFWKLLLLATVCVHWFNPLVWVMREIAHHDLELACDETALAGQDPSRRILYGYALLEHAGKAAE